MTHPWSPQKIKTEEVRLDAWMKALVDANGIIAHAADAIGIHRSYAMKLQKKYDLAGYAAELRLKSGKAAKTGRPRGTSKNCLR